MEQRRVIIVFSEDESEATVTSEVWHGSTRVQCTVTPPRSRSDDLVAYALIESHEAFPTLF